MADRLLRKADIAERLATRPEMAISILKKYGCNPIDFGGGRGRGLRWLESAVNNALRVMHLEAQPAPKIPKPKSPKASSIPEIDLANIKSKDAYAILTPDGPTQ